MTINRMFGSLQWGCVRAARHWRFDDGWGEFSLRWHEAGGSDKTYRKQYTGWYLHTPEGRGDRPLSTRLIEAAGLAEGAVLGFRPGPEPKPEPRDHAVEDFLATEELYQDVLDLVYGPPHTEDINPDDIRRALDRVLSQGKIIGRRSAIPFGVGATQPQTDRLIEDWQHIVATTPQGM